MPNSKIISISIEDEMRNSYIDYSMSVIVARALPDVRDGLKPVHRRTLFGMNELGMFHNRSYRKSARIVGDVLGKYHPHGDGAVYESIVRMVQNFSLRYPLIDGQGNFGSIDGDDAAAMRYTEIRLQSLAEQLLADLHKDTVDFQPNFDNSLEEPSVLPSMAPNLLLNGSSGIAVGMATNMPPHNLRETVNALIAYINNPSISIDELLKHIPAPDFPTGGIIYGTQMVKQAYEIGRGKITLRGYTLVEELRGGREQIIVTEIPYQVNKTSLIERIASLAQGGQVSDISEIRDESDREGMRIVIILKRNADSRVVLNQLYKYSQLQTTFGIINLALVNGRPKVMGLVEILHQFVKHRQDVIIRRTLFNLNRAEVRAHTLEGLSLATEHIDEVIKTIRQSPNASKANIELCIKFGLTDIQANAILDMQLHRLTSLEREKIGKEYHNIAQQIASHRSILLSNQVQKEIIKNELLKLAENYGDKRRTRIVHSTEEFSIEDMIAEENVVVTISNKGLIKRMPLSGYRRQNRGGKGSRGTTIREEEYVEHMFIASTHHYILFFTDKGRCYWLKVHEIPIGSRLSRGRAIINIIQIGQDESVRTHILIRTLDDEEYIQNHHIIMCTKRGQLKKTLLKHYSHPRKKGIIAIEIRPDDELLEAKLTDGYCDVLLANNWGNAIRFHEQGIKSSGRKTSGVMGMRLETENSLIGMIIIKASHELSVLAISEHGYGKRSLISDYRVQNRRGKGVLTLKITPKTGNLIAIKEVTDQDDLMLVTNKGVVIRVSCKSIRVISRNTQGVRIIKLHTKSSIASVTHVTQDDESTIEEEDHKDIELNLQ